MAPSPNPVEKTSVNLEDVETRVYIKNGKIVNHDKSFEADIYIENGIIKFVGPPNEIKLPNRVRIIDAAGKWIIPGGIDPHTHLNWAGRPTIDDFYHGTKAAIAGGTTTIIDFVLPNKGESLMSAYQRWQTAARPKVCCDYAFHMGITWWSKSVAEDMKVACEELGINSFKMYMAYKDELMLNDSEMLDAFERIRELGALAQVHAENGDIIAKNSTKLLAAGITGPEGHELSRQEEVEAEAVNRACILAHQVDCPLYVVHIMSKSAGIELARARSRYRNRGIFGETLGSCLGSDGIRAQHTCFRHASAHVMSPPLRPDPTTPEFMMKLLANDYLQTTGSDNCTFSKEVKEIGKHDFTQIPNGTNGVEDRMSVTFEKGVHRGLIDPCRWVAVTSTNAAKIFNIYPQKGHIAEGSDADIVVWNPNATRTISKDTHHHACDFNIFEGMVCHGVPEVVLVRGRVCVENGLVYETKGYGRFLKTPTRAPYVYDAMDGNVAAAEESSVQGGIKNLHIADMHEAIPYLEPLPHIIKAVSGNAK